LLGQLRRRAWARSEIAALDPERDDERITHLSTNVRYGDPLLVAAAYTLTFARQAAVPSIATVLDRGGRGDSLSQPRKRHRDTILLFSEIYRHGYSTERGAAAIAHLNSIHARFPITNDDYLYTLATVIFEPERLARQVGGTALSAAEERARVVFWREVGTRMGISDIPDDPDAFARWSHDYELEHYRYTDAGRRLVDAAVGHFSEYVPGPLRGLGSRAILALFDEHLRSTHRLPDQPGFVGIPTAGIVRTYLWARRHLPDPGERFLVDSFADGYRANYDVEEIGPPRREVDAPVN
jgi:hypothetical protein